MSSTLRVALVRTAPLLGQLDANRRQLAQVMAAAAKGGAELVIGPELASSGYGFADPAHARQAAEPLDGPTLEALLGVARQHGLWVAAGLLEADGPALHNTAVLVSPDGLVAHHRKVVAAERRWMSPVEPAPATVAETPWGRVGLLICADAYPSLPARAISLRGAVATLCLNCWPVVGLDPVSVWCARARETGMWVLAANRTGRDGDLCCDGAPAAVVDPDGILVLEDRSTAVGWRTVSLPLRDGRIQAKPASPLDPRDPAEMRIDEHRLGLLDGRRALNAEQTFRLAQQGVRTVLVDATDLDERDVAALCLRSLDRQVLALLRDDHILLVHPPREMEPPHVSRHPRDLETLRLAATWSDDPRRHLFSALDHDAFHGFLQ